MGRYGHLRAVRDIRLSTCVNIQCYHLWPECIILRQTQVDAIAVGTSIAFSLNGCFGEPTEVESIHAKQDDIHGKLFVNGYRRYGRAGKGLMSFSIKEGDETCARFYRI